MASQLDLFESAPSLPDGFRYRPELISPDAEGDLIGHIRELPFRDFEFHEFTGKRRTVSFGWTYDFGAEELRPASPLPDFLLPLKQTSAAFAGIAAERLEQVLVTEYGPGATIGWHRDKAVFGIVVGISVLSTCRFRLRRRQGAHWQRVSVDAEPRSAYLLSGPVRTEWEHSIPAVESLRYSVTFRSLR